MSEKETLIHPLIQTTLKNLDLDLNFELNLFEYSLNEEVNSLTVIELSNAIKKNAPQSPLVNQDNSLPSQPEEEPIPVASRIIPPPGNIQDVIFSTWGIFGVIIFIATNALLFIGKDVIFFQESQLSSPEKELVQENTSINQIDSEQVTPNILKEDINIPQIPDLLPPQPIPNNQNSVNSNNDNLSGMDNQTYPDLTTALLSEAVIYLGENPLNSPIPQVQGNVNNTNNQNNVKYYLVTDYTTPEYFTQLKRSIPNAMVTNINQEIKIILGVFTNNNDAQKQAQIFQNQQLPVTIVMGN